METCKLTYISFDENWCNVYIVDYRFFLTLKMCTCKSNWFVWEKIYIVCGGQKNAGCTWYKCCTCRMWKFSQYGVELLTLLLRHDVATPPAAVQLFVSNLIHDSIYIRKVKFSSRLKNWTGYHRNIKNVVRTALCIPGILVVICISFSV